MNHSTFTRRVFSVAELSSEISKDIANQFPSVCVKGEITNFSKPPSGHWYFSLKDQQAQLKMVMFRRNNILLTGIKNGDEVIACGKPSIYKERGDLQLIINSMQLAGAGDLMAQFLALKESLLAANYFSTEHKKPLPELPKQVAVISSLTGAVVHDIQTVTKRRAPMLPLLILPATVQGPEALPSLVEAIAQADVMPDIELIIIARGGGSLEDLAAFNTQEIADAIYSCTTPIISSVGHETDTSIADLCADVRAATPSEAAELASSGFIKLQQRLEQQQSKLQQLIQQTITTKSNQIALLESKLMHPNQRIEFAMQKLDTIEVQLKHNIDIHLNQAQTQQKSAQQQLLSFPLAQQITALNLRINNAQYQINRAMLDKQQQKTNQLRNSASLLEAVSPLKVLARGYGITTNQQGQVIESTEQLQTEQIITTKLGKGQVVSQVKQLTK